MFLLNLSLAEFLALFGAVSGLLVALYLLDRSRRRQKVATLRFWLSAPRPERVKHRRRIQQPWSLVLQLASIALLLLALGQLKSGSPDNTSRDHILVLDTSAWMNATRGSGTLMDAARGAARAWLGRVPAADRVMVLRADALATPATTFETNRDVVLEAIRESRPGSSALNLEQALGFADRVRALHARRPGEIVLVSAGQIAAADSTTLAALPAGVRYLPISGDVENVGLRKVGLRRPPGAEDLWEIFVTARNYGRLPRTVPVALQFGGAPAGSASLHLPPGAETSATFQYRTRAAGWMEIRLLSTDTLAQDDRALLEIPAQRTLRVAVYSNAPDLLRPLFANPRVQAQFRAPSQYQPRPDAEVMILDGFRPPVPPEISAIWIEPPPGAAPVAFATVRKDVRIRDWSTDHELGAGLRLKDVRLDSAQIFSPASGDIPVAETESGPVILARQGRVKTVVMGFHPMRTAMRYELAAPLLFANIFRWMSPEAFRHWELNAGTVGTVTVPVEANLPPDAIHVTADGRPLPYTVQDKELRFFAGTPASVRVQAGGREMVYSLTLPDVGDAVWTPPAGVARGLPRDYPAAAAPSDLWQWLAVAGGIGLLVEWLLFGRRRHLLPATHRLRLRLPWRAKNGLRRAS